MGRIKPPRSLAERASRTHAVLSRYRLKPFDWSKKATCIHVARAQLAAFGHKVPIVPTFRTALGAQKALRNTGHETLRSLFDAMLTPIPPAMLWVGDLALLPGDNGAEAIVVFVGGGQMMGWHGQDLSRMWPISLGEDQAPLTAWRI